MSGLGLMFSFSDDALSIEQYCVAHFIMAHVTSSHAFNSFNANGNI